MKNRLAKEASPYLKMHADNPVDWYPWGDEALEKAQRENKPILLSIGYTACHWCHVMAHESFEDEETAKLMNKLFVNIKVDREERPDLDKIYQLSAQLLTRQVGGWPLTVFLMPGNQLPFFAGTYFPKNQMGNYPSFKEVLSYINKIFHDHPDELKQQNISFQGIIKELESQSKLHIKELQLAPIASGKTLLDRDYDAVHGGFGTAPKFPMASFLDLYYLYAVSGDAEARERLTDTLLKLSLSGIYDHLGGGFFRYSVDEKWQIPHFEKMLYDNALLLTIYTQVYLHSNNQQQSVLREPIIGTANWMIAEMQSPMGGYYATISADSEGKEGQFYIWTLDEIKYLLSDEEYKVASLYYGLNEPPNFQKSWHLQSQQNVEELANKTQHSVDAARELLRSAHYKLLYARAKRIKPEKDEKIILGWNGLALKAVSFAGFALQEPKYIASAEQCLDFIMHNFWVDGKLYSIYKDDKPKQLANLDDYAFLIEGILFLLQARWNNDYFDFMIKLASQLLANFEDKEAGGFYFVSESHEKLIYRLKQYSDEAIPSSNAVATRVILQLGYLLGDNNLISSAQKSLQNAFPHVQNNPDSCCTFLSALASFFNPTQIIVVRGDEEAMQDWRAAFLANSQPNRFAFFIDRNIDPLLPLSDKVPMGEVVAYFCRGYECLPPINSLEDFEHELRTNEFRVTG